MFALVYVWFYSHPNTRDRVFFGFSKSVNYRNDRAFEKLSGVCLCGMLRSRGSRTNVLVVIFAITVHEHVCLGTAAVQQIPTEKLLLESDCHDRAAIFPDLNKVRSRGGSPYNAVRT